MIITKLGNVEVVESCSKFGIEEPAKLSAVLNYCWQRCVDKSVKGTLRVMFELWKNYNNESEDDIVELCDNEHYYVIKLLFRMDGAVECYLSNGRVETIPYSEAKKWGVPRDEHSI